MSNVIQMLTPEECKKLLPRGYSQVYASEKEVIHCMMIAADAVAKKNTVAFNRGASFLKGLQKVQKSLPKVSQRLRNHVEAWRDSEKKDVEADAFILLVDLVDALHQKEE